MQTLSKQPDELIEKNDYPLYVLALGTISQLLNVRSQQQDEAEDFYQHRLLLAGRWHLL